MILDTARYQLPQVNSLEGELEAILNHLDGLQLSLLTYNPQEHSHHQVVQPAFIITDNPDYNPIVLDIKLIVEYKEKFNRQFYRVDARGGETPMSVFTSRWDIARFAINEYLQEWLG